MAPTEMDTFHKNRSVLSPYFNVNENTAGEKAVFSEALFLLLHLPSSVILLLPDPKSRYIPCCYRRVGKNRRKPQIFVTVNKVEMRVRWS